MHAVKLSDCRLLFTVTGLNNEQYLSAKATDGAASTGCCR